MKLALGTVQFGTDYGVTNSQGQVKLDVVKDILIEAKAAGIQVLDTAAAYGSSEQVLGRVSVSQEFNVITKIPALGVSPSGKLTKSFNLSLERLSRNYLSGLLFHAENDLLGKQANVFYKEVISLRDEGKVSKIGASFYSVDAARFVIENFDIDLIQIPANQLDRRFEKSGVLNFAKEKGIEVHARSLFLQGLLAVPKRGRPSQFHAYSELMHFDNLAKEKGLTPVQLALSYLKQSPFIDSGVIGCLSVAQLKGIISAYRSLDGRGVINNDLSSDDLSLINPTNW